MIHRTSIARLADDAPVPHPESWPARPPPSLAYGTACQALESEARATARAVIKLCARSYALRPRELNSIIKGIHRLSPSALVISLEIFSRNFQAYRRLGFGGEIPAINLRGALLYARYARAKAHQISRRAR